MTEEQINDERLRFTEEYEKSYGFDAEEIKKTFNILKGD